MAVEASESGGAGGAFTAEELLARAELEMKKEREMGGEIQHIACPDGDENDGSGTDGSFVMVMNGGDSDARSYSSEKDLGMDARSCGGGAGDLLAANSGSSNFVDDVRVEEGKGGNGVERQRNDGEEERKLGDSLFADNNGKGDDVGGEEDIAHDGEAAEIILSMAAELEEVIDEYKDHAQKGDGAIDFKGSKIEEEHVEKDTVFVEVKNDGNQNQVEEGLVAIEDSKNENDAVIVELDTEDEVMDVEALRNEEQNQVGAEVMMVEDSKNEKDIVIEDLNNEDEALAIDDLLIKEQNQVEEEVVVVADSKNEKEIVIEYLNEEDEVIVGTEDQVSEKTEVPYIQNEVGSDSEGLTVRVSSAKSSSSGPVDRNVEMELVFDESDAIKSAVTELVNKEVESVSEIEELKKASEQKSGDDETSSTEKKESDSSSEFEERRDANSELSVEINYSERAKEESSSVFDLEGRREDNHEECEDVDSSERDFTNKGLDSYSEFEESKNTNDERIKDIESAKEKISSFFELEEKRDGNHEECDDVDSNSKVEENKNSNDEEIKNVEFEITDNMDDEVHSASEVGDRKITYDDLSNFIDLGNEKNSVIQLDENLQINATPTVSDSEVGELNTSVEQVKQRNDNCSLSKSKIVGKEHDSSIELVDEPVKNDCGSVRLVEEDQASEASSIVQSTEPAKEFFFSTSQAKVEYDEAMSISLNREPSNTEWVSSSEAEGGKHAEMLYIASNSEPKEDMDLAPSVEEKEDLDVSFIDSSPAPIRFLASTSEVEEIQDTDAPSVDSNPEPLKEDHVSASKSEDNQNAEALATEDDNEKRELKSFTELADVVALERIEDQTKDLKAEEQNVESLTTEIVNEKKELKSASELTEQLKIHPEKNLGEIKEQHKELKSGEKQDTVHIHQQKGNAVPSAQDGDGEKTEMPAKKHRLIKIPRFTQKVINDEHQAKITDAQVQVDEHTQRRDSLKAELDNMRKVLSDYFHKRDSANEEEKKAKALVNAKRLEMDSVQTVISKGKTAASFLDIISQIHALEHKMQHETISLKDEKKYLHELNQLKHERELHLFSKCSQLEIDEALKQKETAEASLRTLKKEFDTLRSAHLKADEISRAVSKSYIDQFNKVKEHEQKWKTVNELRQNAYKTLHSLKSDKMEHFWKYMDDRQAAKKYASSRDLEGLERHCNEQVERIMWLWNEDDDFRKQYVESNVNNTLRKFGTLDGRTLGPHDPKPVLPSHVSPSVTARSSPAPVTAHKEQSLLAHKVTKPALPTNPMVRSKLPSESLNNVAAVDSPSSEEFVEVKVEKKLTKEEEEQAREEAELREVREELELKEKLRMEQKAKAKEAEERKRRKAERAQAKAEYKAQKEAELRELKKSKKEKKKEAGASEKAGSVEGDLGSVTETSSQEASQEQENNNRTSSKSSRRRSSAALNKYSNKVQPVPIPLRNRGKRRMSTWIWTLCVAVALTGLFFAGNYISFSASWLNFGF